MLVSPGKNGLASSFKEVRVFKETPDQPNVHGAVYTATRVCTGDDFYKHPL